MPDSTSWRRWLALALVALGLQACAGTTESVRAVRQHSREPVSLAAVDDRILGFETTLETVNKLLLETPYTPGDPWVKTLAMDEARAEALTKEVRQSGPYKDEALRVPVAKIYRIHVERALAQASSAEDAEYPSFMAALGEVTGGDGTVPATWRQMDERRTTIADLEAQIELKEAKLNKAVKAKRTNDEKTLRGELNVLKGQLDQAESAQASDKKLVEDKLAAVKLADIKKGAQLVEDLMTISSVAARLEVEAAAMLAVVGLQVPRVVTNPTAGIKDPDEAKAAISLAQNLPGRLHRSAILLEDQVAIVLRMAEILSGVAGLSLTDTPGFAYGESAADVVAGVALDSFYFDASGGAEALFFHFAEHTEPQEESKITYDLTGRTQKLEYNVEPIVLADFNMDFGFDYAGIANFLNLDAGYKTDRVYSSGGGIERSDNAFEGLEVNSAVSDALSAGLAVAGVNTQVKVARFTAGELKQTDLAFAGSSTVPLQITLTQIDLSYDLVFLLRDTQLAALFDALTVGGRYIDYSLPRIVYEFEDTNGDPEQDDYVLTRESPIQNIRTVAYMGGATLRRGTVAGSGDGLILDLGLFAGGGPVEYYLDRPSITKSETLITVNLDGKLGYAFAFLSPNSSFQFDAVGFYNVGVIFSTVLDTDSEGSEDSDLGQKTINFGGADIFHGPNLSARLSF